MLCIETLDALFILFLVYLRQICVKYFMTKCVHTGKFTLYYDKRFFLTVIYYYSDFSNSLPCKN